MDEGLTDVSEQLARSSTNGKAESTHAVQIDPDPKPGQTTLSKWLYYSDKQREERPKPKKGKIHRVPDVLQAHSFHRISYQPQVVSLGPYHFGEKKLRKFQELKRSMADRLVPDKDLEADLRSQIRKKIDRLMDAYSSSSQTMNATQWEEMLFLDGCFVLHFIFCIIYNRVEDLEIERHYINSVNKDLFRVENQLPFELLKILSGNDPKLLYLIDDYIYTHTISNDLDWDGRPDEPVHLLDRLRIIIIGPRSHSQKCKQAIWRPWKWQSTSPPETKDIVLRHAKELTSRGIHLQPNRTGFLKDIFFGSYHGTLTLPRIIVDVSTAILLLNMAAYEVCAEVDSTITSYICFLDSLVNQADDIKELQSVGVLVNHLHTEKMAANLLKEMSRDLHPYKDTYIDVRRKIQKFFQHKTRASIAFWVAEVYHTHFKSPLTAMAFLAACLVLFLTIVQTYFTIFPIGDK